jgi:hypothetical protein
MGASRHREFGPPVERGNARSAWHEAGDLDVGLAKWNGEWFFDSLGEFNPDAFARHKLSCEIAATPFSPISQPARKTGR